MTYFDELGLKAAERLEATLGAWIAIASYERLVDETKARPDAWLEARAILGALRCAIALGDDARTARFVDRWKRVPATIDAPAFREMIRAAARAGAYPLAHTLATAEAGRRPSATARYVAARALELSGHFDHDAYLGIATAPDADVGLRERATALLIEDACRRFDAHGLDPDERATLLVLARNLPRSADAPRTQRLATARLVMMSLRPFERAQGISILCDLVRDAHASEDLREEALHHVAAHVDAWGDRLHPAEVDRLSTALRATRDDPRRAALLARFDLVRSIPTARDKAPPSRLLERIRVTAPELAAATYDASPPEANARSLAELEIALAAGHVPRVAWFLVLEAVRSRTPSIRDVGVRALGPLLRRSLAPPAFGHLLLAHEVAHADPDLSLSLYRLAASQREPDARGHLVGALKRVATRALDRGDETRALALLREAKTVALQDT